MTPPEPVPAATERLIDELASVGAIELLLLLRDAAPGRRDAGAICSVLRCPDSWLELQLARLCAAGLVEGDRDRGYAYAPGSPAVAASVDELARLWGEDRRAITSRLLAAPDARRRTGAARG
jgi:hypothetical protein